ncbi:exonuclease SbcCD subunit D C-terminal domain-containing protein [Nonomuraea sp. SMC257]|uniref:Nuclease SbcCD subunit D n=1 Tax=Nonomuraea montanisoli TaxID=2741721 RepID=A0A7Y6IDB9_9ACTN|nr:exonuclease SbcCD subunit D C-terminal domain-containing protein [Nonomuraea montanisoli]NUW36179.1 exonuclease SbcCD subunit D C-terminal domain-containing protein [Nonomuraea montanisoli]
MRILHTSDWHLGRSFHRESLLEGQAAFVDHLVETVRAERVDVVAVSGDVYDRALPPVDAVSLCNEALGRLRSAGARVILISGNHDSARRLGFGASLFDASGVHLRTDPARAWEPVLVDDVAFYGIPYLEPELVRAPWELDERSHTAALTYAMERVRADAARRRASVVLAHAFVTGGEASDSERDITVGGVAHVPLTAFDGVSYVALGHLHGRQRMSETVRYSGSPLAYSFSEADHVKGSWLVTIGASGAVDSADFVPAPVPRPVARLRGLLDDLLAAPSYAVHEDHWLQITLTDPVRPKSAMDRLRARFPHTLALSFDPVGAAPAAAPVRLSGRPEAEVALDFVREVRGEPAGPDEEELLRQAVEASRMKEAMA